MAGRLIAKQRIERRGGVSRGVAGSARGATHSDGKWVHIYANVEQAFLKFDHQFAVKFTALGRVVTHGRVAPMCACVACL